MQVTTASPRTWILPAVDLAMHACTMRSVDAAVNHGVGVVLACISTFLGHFVSASVDVASLVALGNCPNGGATFVMSWRLPACYPAYTVAYHWQSGAK
jgi:hypothetical protein